MFVVGHIALRRSHRLFKTPRAEQQKVCPQRGAQKTYTVQHYLVAIKQADVGAARIGAGACIMDGAVHLFQLMAIAFVVAMHVQHGQGAEGARGPGDGLAACVDVAGQDHGVWAAGGDVDGRRIVAPDFQVQVGQYQQAHSLTWRRQGAQEWMDLYPNASAGDSAASCASRASTGWASAGTE